MVEARHSVSVGCAPVVADSLQSRSDRRDRRLVGNDTDTNVGLARFVNSWR